jgi:hypothetical protein
VVGHLAGAVEEEEVVEVVDEGLVELLEFLYKMKTPSDW